MSDHATINRSTNQRDDRLSRGIMVEGCVGGVAAELVRRPSDYGTYIRLSMRTIVNSCPFPMGPSHEAFKSTGVMDRGGGSGERNRAPPTEYSPRNHLKPHSPMTRRALRGPAITATWDGGVTMQFPVRKRKQTISVSFFAVISLPVKHLGIFTAGSCPNSTCSRHNKISRDGRAQTRSIDIFGNNEGNTAYPG